VDQWIDFSSFEIEPARGAWLYPIFGIQSAFNPKQITEAKKDILKVIGVLNDHLLHTTFIVGNQITLADITIATAFVELVKNVLTAETLAPFGNFVRWFNTAVNQKQFKAVLGEVAFAKVEAQPKKAEKAKGEEKEAGKEKKEVAKHAAEGKKEKPKHEGKKEGAKKEGGKKEGAKKEDKPKKEQAKKEEKKKEAKEAVDDGDDDDDKPKAPKVKNVLDSLPASPMIFDAVKKLFFLEKPYNKAFFPAFWGPAKSEETKITTYDPAGYSVYSCRYKYEDEFSQYFLAQNLLGGFVQRLDKLRKYGMGVLMLIGATEEKKPWNLVGLWIFRGQDVPFEMKDCDDSEHYNFVKLDMGVDANKKKFEQYLTSDVVDGLPVLDRRFFK